MKFVTHKISTGKAKSFDEIIRQYQEKATIKTASTKVAEADEAESSGQLDVEPLHQTGESTTMPAAGPSAKKDDNSTNSGKATGKEDKEGEDSGQPKAEGKLVNDPKPDKDAKIEDKTEKVAEKCKKDEDEDCECKDCTAAKEEAYVKLGGIKGMCSCGKPNFICKGKCKGECSDDDKKEDKKEDDKKEKEVKDANTQPKFVRLANLDDKSKGWLSDYWKKLYPADYVDAMLADK